MLKGKRSNQLSNMKKHVEQTQALLGPVRGTSTWITVAICLLIRGTGNSNGVFDRFVNALELRTLKSLEPARLELFRQVPPPSPSSEPILLIGTKYMFYESQHTQQQHRSLNKALAV